MVYVMPGEKNIERLINSMSPELNHTEYVFCTIENAGYGDYAYACPIASFSEEEGLTIVVKKKAAEEFGLSYESVFKCITLKVHSSLEAVGLTAAVAGRLCEHGISANVIAGFFHDHIFVPAEFAETALELLLEFAGAKEH